MIVVLVRNSVGAGPTAHSPDDQRRPGKSSAVVQGLDASLFVLVGSEVEWFVSGSTEVRRVR